MSPPRRGQVCSSSQCVHHMLLKERERQRETHRERSKSIPRMESGGLYVFIPVDVLINCPHTHAHACTHTLRLFLPVCVLQVIGLIKWPAHPASD